MNTMEMEYFDIKVTFKNMQEICILVYTYTPIINKCDEEKEINWRILKENE